jgi:hypothetical protein
MMACGILLGATPALCFMIAKITLGIQGLPFNLLLMTFLITVALTFVVCLASFTYLQYDSCKKLDSNDLIKLLANAGIAAGIQTVTLLFVHFTGFISIPMNMIPYTMEYGVKEGIGYGYYSFFASMFGMVLGGTLSSVC